MTEEEYFVKNYPDFCYYDKPLSPYWDLFQYGVEFGERQSEMKIEELKHNKKTVAHLADCLEEKMKERIEELEKENKELKELLNCNNCSELSEEECEVCAEYSHFKCKGKDQLTKAIDIIKQFLNDYPVITKEVLDKLEQFIKEIKEK